MLIESAEIIGLLAGALTAFSTLPQTIKIIKYKKSDSLSTGMLIMLNLSYILWLSYGIILGLFSVILWNVIALVLGTTLLILKFFVWPNGNTENTT